MTVTTDAGRRRDSGVLALAILAPVWGYGWVASKVALGYSTPLTFAALRAGLSIPCLFLVLIVMRRSLRPTPLGYTVAIGLLQTTGFVGLGVWALSSGGAGKVAVLTYTMPFWLLLLARAFLGERLRGTQFVAVGPALIGLVLVVAPAPAQPVEQPAGGRRRRRLGGQRPGRRAPCSAITTSTCSR